MKAFLSLVRGLSRLFGIAAAVMLLLAVLVICEMVFERYVLNYSVYWQTELVTYLLIAATLVGSPYVLLTGGHVKVDVLPMMMPSPARLAMAVLADLAGLAFCAIIAVYGFEYWHLAWSESWDSGTMWGVPMWIPLLAMPVGMGLLSLQYVAEIMVLLAGEERPSESEPMAETGGQAGAEEKS